MVMKYAFTCTTFCLVCIGGRSSMNLMVSAGVSLMVPSINPALPCSALCPALADLSVPLLRGLVSSQ